MSERWGFCGRCQRWFYAQREVTHIEHVRCPVCDASPSTVRVEPTHDAPAVAS